jgi:hypothetical protein
MVGVFDPPNRLSLNSIHKFPARFPATNSYLSLSWKNRFRLGQQKSAKRPLPPHLTCAVLGADQLCKENKLIQ